MFSDHVYRTKGGYKNIAEEFLTIVFLFVGDLGRDTTKSKK